VPALKLSYTDRSGTLHPDALFVVTGLHLELGPSLAAGDYKLDGFHDGVALANQMEPFESRPPRSIPDNVLAALRAQFEAAFYEALRQLDEFSDAEIVT
jgi:hypothetical protein